MTNKVKKSRRVYKRRKSRRRNIIRTRKAPPNGIITKAWIRKECPCRNGDDCVPCPGNLKKYKDGRKR